MNNTLCEQLQSSTQETLQQCRPLLLGAGRTLPSIPVSCDLRGRSAGQVRRYNDGKLHIRYNLEIAKLQPQQFVEETVPHEVAHVITWLLHGDKARAHGQEWRSVMAFLGIQQAQRCHEFSLPQQNVRRQRRWSYECGCQTFDLSSTRHNRILRGTEYRCPRCQETLRPSATN